MSTSNFRPTLPNFSQEDLEEEKASQEDQDTKKSDPLSLIQQIPLVLAPRKPKQESSAVPPTPSPVTTKKEVEEETPKAPKSTVSSSVSVTSSSSTSESIRDIHQRLDELASNLDPWAHIQHASQRVRLSVETLYEQSQCGALYGRILFGSRVNIKARVVHKLLRICASDC